MQLPLSFLQGQTDPAEPSPSASQNVWETLDVEQQQKALALLVRLLAKTAAAKARANAAQKREGGDNE